LTWQPEKSSIDSKFCCCCWLLMAKVHYMRNSFPHRESETSWQLPRLRGSYGETSVMDFGL